MFLQNQNEVGKRHSYFSFIELGSLHYFPAVLMLLFGCKITRIPWPIVISNGSLLFTLGSKPCVHHVYEPSTFWRDLILPSIVDPCFAEDLTPFCRVAETKQHLTKEEYKIRRGAQTSDTASLCLQYSARRPVRPYARSAGAGWWIVRTMYGPQLLLLQGNYNYEN